MNLVPQNPETNMLNCREPKTVLDQQQEPKVFNLEPVQVPQSLFILYFFRKTSILKNVEPRSQYADLKNSNREPFCLEPTVKHQKLVGSLKNHSESFEVL